MTERRKMEGSRLVALLRNYFDARGNEGVHKWNELLEILRGTEVDVASGDREYWLTVYRRRRDDAVERSSTLASDLKRVVSDLESYSGKKVWFALISTPRHGYMVWISEESRIAIRCLRAEDHRVRPQAD